MEPLRRMRALIAVTVALAALLLLAGCGRRGDLEAPAGLEDTSKRVYPAR